GWEVVVGRSRGDVGAPCDVAHRRLGEATLLEEIERRVENSPARLLRLGCRRAGAPSRHDRAAAAAPIDGPRSVVARGRFETVSRGETGGAACRRTARRRRRVKT